MDLDKIMENYWGEEIPDNLDRDYHRLSVSMNDFQNCMKEAIRQACKEQRKICAEEYLYNSSTNDSNGYEINGIGLKKVVASEIESAPEPKIP